jgi:hypothetical protein
MGAMPVITGTVTFPGEFTPLSGTTEASRPELAGLVLYDALQDIELFGIGPPVAVQIQLRVVRSNITACSISITASSLGLLRSFPARTPSLSGCRHPSALRLPMPTSGRTDWAQPHRISSSTERRTTNTHLSSAKAFLQIQQRASSSSPPTRGTSPPPAPISETRSYQERKPS